ncbi:MAG: D-aminoacyl-tRNA deacylase [Eubacteriales bacterium]
MIALIQRGKQAKVTVENAEKASIDQGFLVLLGVFETDTENEARLLAKKTVNLRVFTDENDKMNLSPMQLRERGEECKLLVVSQFTLCAACKGQNRPSFMPAAAPEQADALYEYYVSLLREEYGFEVGTGEFGAHMEVTLTNDGPVTIILDTEKL